MARPQMTAPMTANIYRFGDFRLDLAARVLSRGGEPIALTPKAFDCIGYLVEHRERAVGRDELIGAVWGKADITDNALGQAILQARRALRDAGGDAEAEAAIRTVPRFGYHWQMPVRVETPKAATAAPPRMPESSDTAAPADTSPVRALQPQRRYVGLFLAAVVALAASAWMAQRFASSSQPVASHQSGTLLVLPASVHAGDEHAWMRLGIMDLVAGRLRAAGQPVVPSDNVVALLRRLGGDGGGAQALPELMREAGASMAISVDVALHADEWTVAVAAAGGREAALSTQGRSRDVLDAARRAAAGFADALGLTPPATIASDARSATPSMLLQKVDAALLSGHLEVARELLASTPADRQRPEMRYRRAQVDFRQGRLDDAQAGFEALLADVPASASPVLRAQILNGLSNLAYVRGDDATVLRHAQAAVAALDGHEVPAELGRALIGMASARTSMGRYDEALADYAQARAAFTTAGDQLALARVDAYQGLLDFMRHRPTEALPTLERAAARLQSFDAVIEELHTRVGLLYAQLALLQPAAAAAQNDRLAQLGGRVGDPRRKRYADLARVRGLAAIGRMQAAQALLAELQAAVRAEPGVLLEQTRDELPLVAGQLALTRGDAEAAVREAKAAFALPEDLNNPSERASALLLNWRALVLADRREEAAAIAAYAARWGAAQPQPATRFRIDLIEAGQAALDGRDAVARDAYERALTAADQTRVPADLLETIQPYVDFLIERGDLAQAAALAGRAAGWAASDFDAAVLQVRLYRALGQAAEGSAAFDRARALAGERALPAAR